MLVKDVYCYFEDLGNPNEKPLVGYWCERWQREGWQTHICGVGDARKDPRFDAMEAKHASLPCLPGHWEFGRANYRRWLAWSSLPYCVVADYDVFPLEPFPPMECEGFVNAAGSHGPGFIFGTGKNFSTIADGILNYQPGPDDQWQGIPHVSDMAVVFKTQYDKILDWTGCYPIPPWNEYYRLCHFDNSHLAPYDKMSRADKIRAILATEYP